MEMILCTSCGAFTWVFQYFPWEEIKGDSGESIGIHVSPDRGDSVGRDYVCIHEHCWPPSEEQEMMEKQTKKVKAVISYYYIFSWDGNGISMKGPSIASIFHQCCKKVWCSMHSLTPLQMYYIFKLISKERLNVVDFLELRKLIYLLVA